MIAVSNATKMRAVRCAAMGEIVRACVRMAPSAHRPAMAISVVWDAATMRNAKGDARGGIVRFGAMRRASVSIRAWVTDVASHAGETQIVISRAKGRDAAPIAVVPINVNCGVVAIIAKSIAVG